MWRSQMEWIEGLNRARARLESEDRLTRSERLEDEIGIEPATQLNLEHEPEHEHDKGTAWRAIVPDLYGYGESSVAAVVAAGRSESSADTVEALRPVAPPRLPATRRA